MSEPIVNPLTGEVLDDTDIHHLEFWEARVDGYLRRQRQYYEFRTQLRERIAELRGPAVLPPPRWRTDKQARVAVCPRCGERQAA